MDTQAPPTEASRTSGSPYAVDRLVVVPDDIDLSQSPLHGHLDAETYVLGAFNPGLTRLPNGNLLLMVRVAEALRKPIVGGHVHAIRWQGERPLCARCLAARAWPTPPIRAGRCWPQTSARPTPPRRRRHRLRPVLRPGVSGMLRRLVERGLSVLRAVPRRSPDDAPDGPRDGNERRTFTPDFLTELFRNPLDPGYADAAARKARGGAATGAAEAVDQRRHAR